MDEPNQPLSTNYIGLIGYLFTRIRNSSHIQIHLLVDEFVRINIIGL